LAWSVLHAAALDRGKDCFKKQRPWPLFFFALKMIEMKFFFYQACPECCRSEIIHAFIGTGTEVFTSARGGVL
jgi:hypothetical protein